MLDSWATRIIRPYLHRAALYLQRSGISPDQVTVTGFVIGMISVPAIALNWYLTGLCCILLCRIADGLDGALARISKATDAGGYLDIVLDFIFYAAVVFAFALADPARNGLAATALIFSFIGTGCSFLSFAIMAERRKLLNITYPHKGFYYLGGLAEGTETIVFFVIICLFPGAFPVLAWAFASVCAVTTFTRVVGGYRTLKDDERGSEE